MTLAEKRDWLRRQAGKPTGRDEWDANPQIQGDFPRPAIGEPARAFQRPSNAMLNQWVQNAEKEVNMQVDAFCEPDIVNIPVTGQTDATGILWLPTQAVTGAGSLRTRHTMLRTAKWLEDGSTSFSVDLKPMQLEQLDFERRSWMDETPQQPRYILSEGNRIGLCPPPDQDGVIAATFGGGLVPSIADTDSYDQLSDDEEMIILWMALLDYASSFPRDEVLTALYKTTAIKVQANLPAFSKRLSERAGAKSSKFRFRNSRIPGRR